MELVVITIVFGVVWLTIFILFILGDWTNAPSGVRQFSNRVFSKFWIGLLLHCATFYPFYGAVVYWAVLFGSPYIHPITTLIFWGTPGVSYAVTIVPIMHMRTDEKWLFRRWLVQSLKKEDDPKTHLETLITKIQTHPEKDSSQKALLVLRELAMRGDSLGALVNSVLTEYRLL